MRLSLTTANGFLLTFWQNAVDMYLRKVEEMIVAAEADVPGEKESVGWMEDCCYDSDDDGQLRFDDDNGDGVSGSGCGLVSTALL